KDRAVALFYFLWQGDTNSRISPKHYDLYEIALHHPEVFDDDLNQYWGGARGSYYYWAEPLYGYYRGDDYWVHRRNIQLLTDADVDLLVIDATNRLIYAKQAESLMQAMDDVRKQGLAPPKIAFYTNTRSGETMQDLYDTYYKEGARHRHPDCWFYLDGKPLVIGVSKEAKGTDAEKFFTVREAQWPNQPQVRNGWPWISFTRRPKVHYNRKDEAEIINVSVAQHPNPAQGMGGSAFYGYNGNWGRSYRNGKPGKPATDIPYGYNIQEQWDYALKQNTRFIFITGWNEWVAGRWPSTDGNAEHSYFCDLASPEFSRDIEPTRIAGINDNYYMQMVNNIRRYKGVESQARALPKTIQKMDDWNDVVNTYSDYTGDTAPRNHPSALTDPQTVYKNNTGRNDFKTLKVAHDTENLYFYVQTVEDIVTVRQEESSDAEHIIRISPDDSLALYLDFDRNHLTGWHGYDYRIIAGRKLQTYTGNHWETKLTVEYLLRQNRLMITVPRASTIDNERLDFEFKWSDNMQSDDPLDWYLNGDAAPGGRFNFIYKE
ncbi:MAG: hypothetical protein LBS80_04240, partial [Tannerella sp.]|nr:hypothetical protein [Tannerella sp.]